MSGADYAARPTHGMFLLGAGTLMAEILWARELGLVLGSDLAGIALAVGIFLGGASLGAWRAARSTLSPDTWMWRAVIAAVFAHCWCAWILPALSEGRPALALLPVRLAVAAPVGAAAYAMGGAAGAWFRALDPAAHGARRGTGAWISALDLGSAAGAILTPLALLPYLGRTGGAFVTLGTLIASGLIAARSRASIHTEAVLARAPAVRLRTALAVWMGCTALALEGLWCRLLGEVLGTSWLVLGVASAAFLLGGSLASRLAPWFLGRISPRALVAWSGALWCALEAASALLIAYLPECYIYLVAALGHEGAAVPAIKAALALAVIFPPALAAGAMFPALISGWCAERRALSAEGGAMQGAALAGGAAGMLLTGLHGIPTFGSGVMLAAIAIASAGIPLLALRLPREQPRERGSPGAALLLLGAGALLGALGARAWDPGLLGAGVFQWSREDLASGRALAAWREREVVYAGEGRLARVTIERAPAQNTAFLRIGGRVEGTVPIVEGSEALASLADMPTQLMLALLAYLDGGAPESPLIVGLGGGTTAAAAIETLGPEVTVLEIEEEVARALRSGAGRDCFPWEHERLFRREGVRLVFEDARTFLHREPRLFGAIVCQPSEPWLPWSAPLFTPEFYRRVRSRLAPGGVAVHWVQLHRIGEPELAAILAGFRACFEQVRLYHPRFVDPRSGSAIPTAEVLLVGGGVERSEAERRALWDGAGARRCRARVANALPYPEPLLRETGIDAWLVGRAAESSSLRGRLEYRLPLLGDRGEDWSGELLRSLHETAERLGGH